MTAIRLHRSLRASTALVGVGLLVTASVATAAPIPIPITACGTVVAEQQQGVLMADLSCGTLTGVVMQRGAALDLNGHAIVTFGEAVHADFDRSGRISVNGPGQISGCDSAIGTSGRINDRRRVIARNLDVVGCTIGIAGSSVRVDDVSVTGSLAAGIYADFGVIGKNVVASNNGTFGVVVPYGPVRIRNLTANGNGWQGVLAAKASLRDSTVTGNDAANGIDIGTTHRPSLKAVTCGLSAHEPFLAHVAGPPWGVCAND